MSKVIYHKEEKDNTVDDSFGRVRGYNHVPITVELGHDANVHNEQRERVNAMLRKTGRYI